jgi:hypothetical protein
MTINQHSFIYRSRQFINISMATLPTGQIPNFFPLEKVQMIVQTFARLNSSTNKFGNQYHGIGPDHLGYLFVKRQLLDPINKHFNTDAQLVFAFYLDCISPVGPHFDLHKLPGPGKHWCSFLIPYSVDNDVNLCSNASTVVLNEWGYDKEDELPVLPINILDLKHELLSHVADDICVRHSLAHNAIWHPGDLIFWDSRLSHLSNDFVSRGFTSKQAVVIHTYLSH